MNWRTTSKWRFDEGASRRWINAWIPTLPEAEIKLEALEKQLRGSLLTPDSPEYDARRRIWNAMIACIPFKKFCRDCCSMRSARLEKYSGFIAISRPARFQTS